MPKCDKCYAQATSAAVDVIRNEKPGDAYASWERIGPNKYGCEAHPVESHEIDA